MKLVTHNDRFHADDVFALATLRIKFGTQITEVIRTRDETIIASADIVFDVGNVYDESKNRFDHHQKEQAGVRENGIPYAAFGLVWKKWGNEICGSEEASQVVDKKLVQMIDARDNGKSLYSYTQEDVHEYVFGTICGSFGSTWKEEDNYDVQFFQVVDFAEKLLRREILCAQHKIEAIPFVQKAYELSEDKRLVVLDSYYPWGSTLEKYPEILFVVSPNKEKTLWRINAIQLEGYQNRKNLPSKWAGLRDEELENVSGVVGATFCHRSLFMAAAKTKEAATALAKIAIQA